MENEKLKNEIVGAITIILDDRLDKRFDEFGKELKGEMKGMMSEMKKGIDERFDQVDAKIDRVELLMEDMDDKFILITEGQDVIREVLETRVAHIEEVLDVNATV